MLNINLPTPLRTLLSYYCNFMVCIVRKKKNSQVKDLVVVYFELSTERSNRVKRAPILGNKDNTRWTEHGFLQSAINYAISSHQSITALKLTSCWIIYDVIMKMKAKTAKSFSLSVLVHVTSRGSCLNWSSSVRLTRALITESLIFKTKCNEWAFYINITKVDAIFHTIDY